MKVFIVERPVEHYCEDYKMIVLARNAKRAECIARLESDSFTHEKDITITEVDMDEEQVIATENTGA